MTVRVDEAKRVPMPLGGKDYDFFTERRHGA